MNDAMALTCFSLGVACTLTVLLTASQRTYRLEQERSMMERVRRRLNRMLMNQNS